MALQLPDWYEGPHYPNLENVLHDWLQDLLPNVAVVHWLRPGIYEPGDGQGTEPTLRIWRMPGNRNLEIASDIALVQFAAVTRSRSDSWDLIEFVNDVLTTLNNGVTIPHNGSLVRLTNVKPWIGPQEIPEELIDEFFIPVTWQMTASRKNLIPDYARILKTLSN